MSPLLLHVCRGADREGVLCVLSSAFRNMNSMAKIAPNFSVKRPNSVFRAGVFKDQLTRDNDVLPLPSRAWDLQDTCQGDWSRSTVWTSPEPLYRNVLPGINQPNKVIPLHRLFLLPCTRSDITCDPTYTSECGVPWPMCDLVLRAGRRAIQ